MDTPRPAPTAAAVRCPSCAALVRPDAPPLAWKIGAVALWTGLAALGCASALLGPWLVFLSPVLMVVGLGFIGPVRERAFADPACPECGKVLSDENPAPVAAPYARPVAAVPAPR